ncbi:hypothetical protein MKX03_015705, partial [Papaver bracteatum]
EAERSGLKREDMLSGLKALEEQVSDLTSQLVQCCGAAGGGSSAEQPWITGQAVPNNWVSFEDLDFQKFTKNIPLLAITKATSGLKFEDDNSTNVEANHFCRGIYPIVVVDIAELTPNREEARFDPNVWSLYKNSGTCYAAREPSASEMLIAAHTTG